MVYMGSKKKYVKYIAPKLQFIIEQYDCPLFIDMMCGGCNVIDHIDCEYRLALDKNEQLIDLYNKAVYTDLQYPKDITRPMWDSCKDHPEENPPWFVALVEFFGSYNAGGFAKGYCGGRYGGRNHYEERLSSFQRQIPKLDGVKFRTADIFTLNVNDWREDFSLPLDANVCIYIDPPYKNTTSYGISKDFDYRAFWEKVRDLSKQEHNFVFVSEQKAPDDFIPIWSKETKRKMQGQAEATIVTENLFAYKPFAEKYL